MSDPNAFNTFKGIGFDSSMNGKFQRGFLSNSCTPGMAGTQDPSVTNDAPNNIATLERNNINLRKIMVMTNPNSQLVALNGVRIRTGYTAPPGF
jgi:hypothetical protein